LSQEAKAPAGKITEVPNPAAGYLMSHEVNDSFIAVNRLLQSKEDVYWIKNAFSVNGKTYPPGTQFISAKAGTLAKLQRMAQEIGLSFDAIAARPQAEAFV